MGWLESDRSNFEIFGTSLNRYIGDEEIVWVPEDIRRIESHAFERCKAKAIWLRRNIQVIKRFAFHDCANLQAIIFGEAEATAAHIERFAVDECPNLTAIEVPQWCTYEDNAFPPWCKVIKLRF